MQISEGGIKWLDFLNPVGSELKLIRSAYQIHPLTMKELEVPSARGRVEGCEGYIYLAYHFPVYDAKEEVSKRTEVDFVIAKDTVVTVHYDRVEAFEHFEKKMRDPEERAKVFANSLTLTHALFSSILSFNMRQLKHVQEKVEEIASLLFKDKEREVLTKISYVKRDISEYRIITRPQEHILHALLESGPALWDGEARLYLTDLINEHVRLMGEVEDYHQAVSDYEDTNNQLMDIRSTEVMRRFSALSFMTFPFVLLSAVFAMNFETPFSEQPVAFWIVIGIIVSGIVSMYIAFKSKKWL